MTPEQLVRRLRAGVACLLLAQLLEIGVGVALMRQRCAWFGELAALKAEQAKLLDDLWAAEERIRRMASTLEDHELKFKELAGEAQGGWMLDGDAR